MTEPMSPEMFLHCVVAPWGEKGGFDLAPLIKEWTDEIRAEAVESVRQSERALCERLKQEAINHAGEARNANATLNEIYQLVSGATGEKANWNGAAPVREYIEKQKAKAQRLVEALQEISHVRMAWQLSQKTALEALTKFNDEGT